MEFGRQAEDESPNPPPSFQDSVFTKPLPSFSSSSRVVGVGAGGGAGAGVGARGESTVHSHPLHPTASAGVGGDDGVGASGASRAAAAAAPAAEAAVRYHECLRNHAASLGGHVVDGCCEFMPATAADPLKCAACGCHRSFHRKDLPSSGGGGSPYYHQPNGRVPLLLPPPPPHRHRHHFSPAFPPSPPAGAMAFTSGSGGTTTESSSEERNAAAHAAFASPSGASKKRFRTKFTAEQKEKMLAFAQRANWRIQRQDDAATERFCAEIGVSRHVLKVWMHNNKHSLKRQQQQHEQQQEQQQQHQQQILQPSSPI